MEQADALGRVTSFGFDNRRNQTRLDLPDHDGNSTLTTTSYAYNLADQLTSTTDPLGRITSYDTLGRLDEIALPDPDGAAAQPRFRSMKKVFGFVH